MNLKVSFLVVVFLIFRCCETKLAILDESNWSDAVVGEWMLEFFAPWCPACKALEPVWKEFAGWSDDLGINVGQVDVTNNPGLSGRFMVTALPTIYHVKDGVFRQYRGSRDKDSFISFIEEKKWQVIDPIPSWKTPQSIQMSAVSYFFKLSMALRSIHTRIVDDFGIPYWMSYIMFALATVVLGAILGLMVVCVIDIIFPQKLAESMQVRPVSKEKKTDGDDAESSANETDDDDNVIDDTVPSSSEVRKRNVGDAEDKSKSAD